MTVPLFFRGESMIIEDAPNGSVTLPVASPWPRSATRTKLSVRAIFNGAASTGVPKALPGAR